MSMTLTEAIQREQEMANSDCSREHEQLAKWLTELKQFREQNTEPKLVTLHYMLDSLNDMVLNYADDIKMYCEYRVGHCNGCPFYKEYTIDGVDIIRKCSLNSKPRNWQISRKIKKKKFAQ